MSAGIPTIAGYIWASAADGFRKWRFNGMRVEDGGTTGYADFAWVGGKCAGFSSEPRNPSPQNRRRAVHFRAQASCLKERNYPAVRPAVGALTIEMQGVTFSQTQKKPPRRLQSEWGPVANDGTSIYDYFS